MTVRHGENTPRYKQIRYTAYTIKPIFPPTPTLTHLSSNTHTHPPFLQHPCTTLTHLSSNTHVPRTDNHLPLPYTTNNYIPHPYNNTHNRTKHSHGLLPGRRYTKGWRAGCCCCYCYNCCCCRCRCLGAVGASASAAVRVVCLRIPQQALGGKLGCAMEGQPVNMNKSEGR